MKTLKFLALTLWLFCVCVFASVLFLWFGAWHGAFRILAMKSYAQDMRLSMDWVSSEIVEKAFHYADTERETLKPTVKRKLVEPDPHEMLADPIMDFCVSYFDTEMVHIHSDMVEARSFVEAKEKSILKLMGLPCNTQGEKCICGLIIDCANAAVVNVERK